jgi:hypothetical protein
MVDLEGWKRRHEELIREAERNRLAKRLRDSRKRSDSSRVFTLTWEIKRCVGNLLKLLTTEA